MTRQQANLLLLLITIGWGSSYLFTKLSLRELEPIGLVGLRFFIAFIITFIFFFPKLKHAIKQTYAASSILGILLASVSITFSYSLKTVNASTASFLVATTVIFVPIIMTIITRKIPNRSIVIGAFVALIGLAVFTLKGTFTFTSGMLLCLFSAFLYALHIVLNNYFVREHDGLQLGVLQLGFAGLCSLILSTFLEGFHLPSTLFGWSSLLGLAIVCSAFAVIAQSMVQKYTTAVATGFILSTEPIFAALLGFIFLNEHMTPKEYIGAAIIFCGVIIANINLNHFHSLISSKFSKFKKSKKQLAPTKL